MKSIQFCVTFCSIIIIFFVINKQVPTFDIIQYCATYKQPYKDDFKKVELTVNNKKSKMYSNDIDINFNTNKPERKRIINEVPIKSLHELKMEIVLIEEQGTDSIYAAFVYYEYGNALLKTKFYDQAIEAFEMAEKYKYQDLKTLYFKISCAYALEGKYYGEMEDYLIKAKEKGFKNYRALLYDKAFNKWNNEYDFMYLYQKLFGSNKKAMFNAFIILAPQNKFNKAFIVNPMSLFENTCNRKKNEFYKTKPLVNGYFSDFIEGVDSNIFSRSGGDDYRYEMILTDQRNYVALIYSIEQSCPGYILPKKYRLITFDKAGNKISELEIANGESLNKCKGFVFYPDNSFEVTNYNIKWKKNSISIHESNHGFLMHDDLKKAVANGTKKYFISENGRIRESEFILLGMN
ncbi:MAG: hypothetical protein MK207_10275 [Saprospiraceae bacterium]|nr:hypothetical protein [Saprospiraceae bacterium]